MTPSARAHHLRFAHEALPRFGLMGNPRALDILATPMGQPFLLDIWEKVGGELPKQDKQPPNGLHCSTHQAGDRRILLISLPAPAHEGEVYYVAFVTVPEKRKMMLFKSPAVMRCFALERRGAGTALLEHQKEGPRQELGAGPPPDAAALVAHLDRITA